MDVKINVPRIVQAMKENGWGTRDTCVNCGMNNKTLANILDGKMPRRIDAFRRLCDGLGIKPQEVLINAAHGPSGSVASHHNAGMFNTMKEEMIEGFVALLKETTDPKTLDTIMRTIKLFRRGSR